MKPILEAQNLTIGYEKTHILSDLNFKLYPGDFIPIMGSNGRGKTTLLKTLSALLIPLSGQITILDKQLDNYSVTELSRLIAVVLTEALDLPNINVFDFVSMGRVPYTNYWGALKKKDQEIIAHSLHYLKIDNIKNKFFNELSDGQKQKVLIARALAQDTPIILLDEPTSFLDIPRKMELMLYLKRIAKDHHKAILFTSHDWELALEMNTHLWLIDDDGRMNMGMPEEIVLSNKLFDSFVSDDIIFSTSKGHFEEVVTPINWVSLWGEINSVKWTKHALRKNKIGSVANAEVKIECHLDHWIISKGEKNVIVNDLFSLIWFDFNTF